MSREIKFRGWHKPTSRLFEVYSISPDKVFENSMDGVFSSDTLPADTQDCIIQQYTGLKDKNGIDIYEGDIVRWDDRSNGKYWRVAKVFYDDDEAMFCFEIIKNTLHELSCKEGKVFSGNFALRGKWQNPSKELEVIGNIYENPELLNKKAVAQTTATESNFLTT